MAKLTTAARKKLPTKAFALPSKREGGKGGYPIPDASHARNALARVSQHGSPSEKKTVRAKVHAKFPGIGQTKGGNTTISKDSLKGRGLTDGRETTLAAKKHFTSGAQTKDSLARKENPDMPVIWADKH